VRQGFQNPAMTQAHFHLGMWVNFMTFLCREKKIIKMEKSLTKLEDSLRFFLAWTGLMLHWFGDGTGAFGQ
jgi:hypothetical protein